MTKVLSTLFCLCTVALSAQQFSMDNTEDTIIIGFHMEAYFDHAIPIRDFGDDMYQNGVGVGFQMLYNVQGPIWLGLGLHTFRFDHFEVSYFDFDGGDRFEIEEITASRAVMGHLVARFQPIEGEIFTPYVQAGVGWHWYYTNTRLTDVEFDEEIDRFKDLDDSRLGYGIYAGVLITSRAMTNIGLDIRFGYLGNAAVEYMSSDPESRNYNGGFPIEYFEVNNSAVDMLNLNVGLTVRF